ncbi:MAG: acyltransferase [Deltaproteobacteria bacterium]|nr:acyltransferase [Deltaproteobacteria bacterium]
MKAGFVQFEPLFGEVNKNIERAEMLIDGTDADLLVLPELFNTGYVFTAKGEVVDLSEEVPKGKTTQALCRMAKNNDVYIVAGIAEKSGDKYFNSAVIVSPQGYLGTYRKIHLFFEEKLWFNPGDGNFEVYDIGPYKFGVMICFDWIFPESMRVLSLKGAYVICHSANLVLPFCQDAMKTRCLENRVFAITANRTGTEARKGKSLTFTGKSQITGHTAEVLYQAAPDTDEVGIVDIDMTRAENKRLNEYNDIFEDRRTEFYKRLLQDLAE